MESDNWVSPTGISFSCDRREQFTNEAKMNIDYDDPEIYEMVAQDRYDRRLMGRLLSNPDPRDPEYPVDDYEEQDNEI